MTGGPAGGQPRKDDATRQAELKAMKRVATGLLLVALVVFVVARILEPAYPWLGFIRATAEASLVGGLADWFAVTALFRRPMGLPIPHTAIIPTEKDRIGKILGNFVQNHFMSRATLSAQLHGMKVAERTARWLADPDHSAQLARHVAVGVARAVQALPETQARDLIRESTIARLHAVQLAPVLGGLLAVIAADERHQLLLDEALRLFGDALESNREGIRRKIKEESPWWVPGPIDTALHRRIVEGARHLIAEVKQNPRHPLRLKFDSAVRDLVERLRTSPETIARTEHIKEDLLGHPAVEAFAGSLWERARAAATRYTGEDEGGVLEPLARGISAIGESLLANEARLAELDELLTNLIASLLERHQHEVGNLIAETVKRWDPEAAARRIELAVGRDLQFIRLNGTLVGGLAGLAIYTITMLLR